MARDWTTAFRRASFRGALFWVEKEGKEGGRRLAIHEIAGADDPIGEDFGRRTGRFMITAYVAGEGAPEEAAALMAALDGAGFSTLTLPMDAGFTAGCLGYERNRERDKNGYVAFDIEFIRFGGTEVSFAPSLGPESVNALVRAGAKMVAAAVGGIL